MDIQNFKSIAERLCNVKAALPVLYLVVGIIFGGLCYIPSFDSEHPTLFRIFNSVAGVLVISALISFLMTTARYMGVFKEALEEIVYSPRFLEKRNDIEQVWENVSYAMFKSKLPSISHAFLRSIKEYYISASEDQFYENYRAIIDISWLDKKKQWVQISYDVDFDLITESEKRKNFTFNSWTYKTDDDEFCTKTEITKYSVDGQDTQVKSIGKTEQDGEIIERFQVEINGKKKYSIKEHLNKTMCLRDDNFCAFNCKWLVNNMDIQIYFPEDMDVKFVGKGTAEEFILVNKRQNSLRYEYKGLILRSQGYLFILTSK